MLLFSSTLAIASQPCLTDCPPPQPLPCIISANKQNLLSGCVLSSTASVAASQGSSGLLPVALSLVPYSLAALLSYAVAHSAQRRDEHFFHVAACQLAAGISLALFAPLARAAVAAGFVSLALGLALNAAGNGPGVALVGRLCRGPEQVGGQARGEGDGALRCVYLDDC